MIGHFRFLVKGSSHSLPRRGEVHMHAVLIGLAQTSNVWRLQGMHADFSYKWGAKSDREGKGSHCQDRALQRHGALAHRSLPSRRLKKFKTLSKVDCDGF